MRKYIKLTDRRCVLLGYAHATERGCNATKLQSTLEFSSRLGRDNESQMLEDYVKLHK